MIRANRKSRIAPTSKVNEKKFTSFRLRKGVLLARRLRVKRVQGRVTRCLSRVAMIVSSHVEEIVPAGLPEPIRIVNNATLTLEGELFWTTVVWISATCCDILDSTLAETHGRQGRRNSPERK